MKVIYQGLIPLNPRTKKNSQQIKYRWNRGTTGTQGKKVPYISPSEAFMEYQDTAGYYLKRPRLPLEGRYNVKAHFYMGTRGKVDISNLNSAIHDILVHYHILKDDDSKIVVATDGSRVFYDKDNPRTEFWIEEMED